MATHRRDDDFRWNVEKTLVEGSDDTDRIFDQVGNFGDKLRVRFHPSPRFAFEPSELAVDHLSSGRRVDDDQPIFEQLGVLAKL